MRQGIRKAYGMNRTESQFKKLDIFPKKFFIDNKSSGLQERLDLMLTLREGDTVVVLSLADFGSGTSQTKAVNAIEAKGAKIEVAGGPVAKLGRPGSVKWKKSDLDTALEYWGVLPEKEALAAIKRDFKIETDRNHMNYQKRLRADQIRRNAKAAQVRTDA